jgi:hypothetical protein
MGEGTRYPMGGGDGCLARWGPAVVGRVGRPSNRLGRSRNGNDGLRSTAGRVGPAEGGRVTCVACRDGNFRGALPLSRTTGRGAVIGLVTDPATLHDVIPSSRCVFAVVEADVVVANGGNALGDSGSIRNTICLVEGAFLGVVFTEEGLFAQHKPTGQSITHALSKATNKPYFAMCG